MKKKKYIPTKGKKLPTKQLKRKVAHLFAKNKSKRLSAKQVQKKLHLQNNVDSIKHVFSLLEKEGLIKHIKDNKYSWNKNATVDQQAGVFPGKVYIGKVDMIRSGAAYIVIDDLDDDVYVAAKNLNGAMSNDTVKVSVPAIRGKRRPEGKVISVVKRGLSSVLGKIRKDRKYAIVYPLGQLSIKEVYVKFEDMADAQDGDAVVVKIKEYGQGQNKAMWGEVTRVLKDATENDIAMQGILLSQGFDLEFPPEVLDQVKYIKGQITQEEIDARRDMRDVVTFTIDPDTAKDFDDALSYQELEDGMIEIGIHIADVSHYIPPGSPLDKEALKRSTSVYLVDRVLPMLPEKLSNDLCSLNPNEDKYTFSAVFTFDRDFKIKKKWFGHTLIHSDRRFTYEDAQEIIETGTGDYAKEILAMNKIAHKLRKEKFKYGAISFESEEIKFILDETGKPIGLYVKERKDAHKMIEDFMLLANKSVAQYISKKKPEVPFIYRVHDLPNEEKLHDFALFAKEMGYPMKIDTPKQIAKSLNGLFDAAEKNEELKLLIPLAIRTMSKAIYTTENIGHYGLAFDHYTHFTSPIRRYSDVLVHRILFGNLDGRVLRVNKAQLEAKAKHISAQERKATDAERESVKYKQVEYIMDHIGEEFDGVISGMIDRGVFVNLINTPVEGMVSFDRFDEPFEVAQGRLFAIGKYTGKKLKMGQKIKVVILDADLEKRQIEMDVLYI